MKNLGHENKIRQEATKSYDSIIYWHKYTKETPEDLPILDKLKLKKIEEIIETWEDICDHMESTIK